MLADSLRSTLLYGFQIGIGVVWIVAAVGKARTLRGLRDEVRRLLGGPTWAVSTISLVIAPAELTLGILLITGWNTPIFALMSAALFFLFALLIGRAAIRASVGDVGCGCFGTNKQPVNANGQFAGRLIARNFLLGSLALVVASGG